jgi:hypothetical protein
VYCVAVAETVTATETGPQTASKIRRKTMSENVSIRPSEMVEGGGAPVDQNLTVKAAKFAFWDYNGTAPQTTAAKLDFTTDEGVEYTQYYSVGDTSKFVPSQDGKSLVAVGSSPGIRKSSNFAILMDNMVNSGFPENKLGNDVSVLDGLYAYWIGVPEPKRSGLQRTEEQKKKAENRVILVPQQVHSLPWEKKSAPKSGKSASKPAPAAQTETEVAAESDVEAKAIEFAILAIEKAGGSITKQNLAVKVFQDLAKDPDRDAIAKAVFSPELSAKLVAMQYEIEGDTISR